MLAGLLIHTSSISFQSQKRFPPPSNSPWSHAAPHLRLQSPVIALSTHISHFLVQAETENIVQGMMAAELLEKYH